MKLSHLASPALFLTFVMASGCASDPAKKADDAHDQQLEDQRKADQAQFLLKSHIEQSKAEVRKITLHTLHEARHRLDR